MRRRFRRPGVATLAASLIVLGLVTVPATTAVKSPKRYANAAALPALKSGKPVAPKVRTAVGRSSAVVHGLRATATKGGGRYRAATAPAATTAVAPADGAVVTTLTPTLEVSAVSGASYRFKVTTKSDAETGTIVADTLVTGPSLTVPAGALKDLSLIHI